MVANEDNGERKKQASQGESGSASFLPRPPYFFLARPALVVRPHQLRAWNRLLYMGSLGPKLRLPVANATKNLVFATRISQLVTRICHLATEKFCLVASWRQHKKVNFGPWFVMPFLYFKT